MSLWEDHDLTDKVLEVLNQVPTLNDFHHFGRPYVSSYQIAIDLKRRFPRTVAAIRKPLGGRSVGQHNSLAQYVGNELSKQIKTRGTDHPVEGAFISNQDVDVLRYAAPGDGLITSSLTGTGYDLALFRLRTAPTA